MRKPLRIKTKKPHLWGFFYLKFASYLPELNAEHLRAPTKAW